MSMSKARRQMPAQAGRAEAARGEAERELVSDEAAGPRHEPRDAGNPRAALLHAALTRENLQRAFKRVRANKGAAGVDGLDIDQTARHLSTAWPVMALSAALVGGAVMIPGAASTAFVRRCVRQPGADAALATYSVVFAAGQCIGPVPAGFIADATGSLSAALALSAALLLLGATLASRQREMVR